MKNSNKTTALQTLEHATVSNTINLNLNQGDLIDLVLAEKLDTLTGQRKKLLEQITEISVERSSQCDEYLSQVFMKNTDAAKKFRKLALAFCKYHQDNRNPSFSNNMFRIRNYNSNTANVGKYEKYDQDILSNHQRRTPNHYENNLSTQYPIEFYINVVARNVEGNDFRIESKQICLTDAEKEILKNKITEALKPELKIRKELFKVETEMCKYLFQEKTVKAQLTRSTLNKTVEGKKILDGLRKATGIK